METSVMRRAEGFDPPETNLTGSYCSVSEGRFLSQGSSHPSLPRAREQRGCVLVATVPRTVQGLGWDTSPDLTRSVPTAPKTEPSPRKQSSNQHKRFMESKVRHRKDQETMDFSSNEKTKPQGDEVLSSRSHPQLSTKLKDRPTFLTKSLLVPSWCEMLDTEIILEGTEHRGNSG